MWAVLFLRRLHPCTTAEHHLSAQFKAPTVSINKHLALAQARLASQAVVVGRHLWLIAGWDPGHNKDGGDILSDLWRLDLETYAWKQITPQVSASCCPHLLWSAACEKSSVASSHASLAEGEDSPV